MDKDKEIDIVRAWKDEEYRNNLTPQQLAKLPPNPAGDVELDDEDLDNVSGGIVIKKLWKCVCPKQHKLSVQAVTFELNKKPWQAWEPGGLLVTLFLFRRYPPRMH